MSVAEASGAVALCSVDRAAGHVGDQHGINSAFVGPGTSPKRKPQDCTRETLFSQLCFKST